MRVFVAGATGVVGRRVIPRLLAAGHQVTAVARTPQREAALAAIGAVPVFVDLFDAGALRRVVARHDAVVNLATHIPSSTRTMLPGAWRENDRIRTLASANLAEAAAAGGAERFVQESFAPAYPERGAEWIEESTPIHTVRYNRSIEDAERSAERFSRDGRSGIVLRFGMFYGPDSAHTLELIASVRKGWAPVLGDGAGFISSISTEDAAAAVVAVLAAPAGVYNVVDDEPVRRRDYADALAAALGVARPKLPPAWMKRLLGGVGETIARSQRISNRKLREADGWAPTFPSVREGWRAVVTELGRPSR